MSYNPFAPPEWQALQAQLLIGIQYAIYELAGIIAIIGISLFFIKEMPYAPMAATAIFVFTCFKNVRRLTKLSADLEKQLDQLDQG